uniref:CitMHS domain-containing protein n=1 Tax=Globodera pallida TaxID=36090 RepID=A0A183CDV5_GLOPA
MRYFVPSWMAVYWTCEVMPIGITALLPTVLFPVMGILTARDVSHEFLNDTNFLFIGGLVVASAVEKCGLHERVALRVLSLIGSEPRRVMLGFMLITAILSMFISNTATCAMMLPIGQSVILQFVSNSSDKKNGNGCTRNGLIESDALTPEEAEAGTNNSASNGLMLKRLCSRDDSTSRMAKGLILSIAFGANIGGVGTPTGTASNLVLVGMLSTLFPDADTGVNYMSWMALTVPLMCCCLVACWALLSLMFLRNVTLSADHHHVAEMMRMRAQALPPMSFAQKSVAGCFMLLLLLWIGRDPGFMPGLGALFPRDFYTDSTSVMAIAILLFLLPAENPLRRTDNNNNNNGTNSEKKSGGNGTTGKRLMDWPTMQKQFPWGVVLLLGGGFALAAGVKESGLSKLMANALGELEGQPGWVLQLICIVVIMLVTNICSNAVTASIFIPIVASMAQRAQLHPLALMLPTTLACSFAFVLPVGTPPNALAIGSGLLRVSDLMLSGLAVSAVSATLTIAYLATVAPLILPIDRFPEWAAQTVGNGTTDTVAEGIGLRLLDVVPQALF